MIFIFLLMDLYKCKFMILTQFDTEIIQEKFAKRKVYKILKELK